MGHSTITMTMRYAHLSPAHREAVNRVELRKIEIGSGTYGAGGKETEEARASEHIEIWNEKIGGAERI